MEGIICLPLPIDIWGTYLGPKMIQNGEKMTKITDFFFARLFQTNVLNKNNYYRPGLNWIPSACKADVITTTPR